MSILIAVIIFSSIILFHELGHFLLARANGITVTEFSLGFGPRIWSVTKKGTTYSLKALPFGGSCAMLGEDTDDEGPGSFHSASVLSRILVVAAGPGFNFILAFVLSIAIVGYAGYDPARVTTVTEGSASYEAGLREGDIITRYNGYSIDLARDLYVYTYMNGLEEGKEISMTVLRDGEKIRISFFPDVTERYLLGFNRSGDSMQVLSLIPGYPLEDAGLEPGDTIVAINGTEIADSNEYDAYIKEHPLDGGEIEVTFERNGLRYDVTIEPAVYRTPSAGFSYSTGYQRVSGAGILKYSFLEMKYMVRSTLLSLKELVTGGIGVEELSGPVGVVDAIGETYTQTKSEGFLVMLINLISMAVLLSTNLGVMNLLPLPALDGGRLVFLAIEAVRRKPINRNVEGSIHFTGLILLFALMGFIMYSDILKLIR